MITLEKIEHCYGNRCVLKDINYVFSAGSIYGVIGPNGAGKSTLLKIITGFEKPTQGRVIIDKQILQIPNTDIAIVWQKPYLFKTSVKKNIAYGLNVRKWRKDEIAFRVNELLKIFDLEKLANNHSNTLSGGEVARVAIARAIACQPKVLILDEPGANLDPVSTKTIEQILKEIQEKENMTIIIVTHDMFQAKRLADFTIFLSEGKILEANKTYELFINPQVLATKKFLAGELS